MPAKTERAVDLMMDSGTFSAWNRGGEPINLKNYIAYLKEHEKLLFSYVNLDVIPGTFGTRATRKQTDESAAGGYRNLQRMKDKGLRPMPVFHQGEELGWLEQLLKDGEDYIGISTSKDLWASEQRQWLDEVFMLLTNSKGQPLIKTHGFGITRPGFLHRYPWYSVDSTTWMLTSGYGHILIPQYDREGAPDYAAPPCKIVVSGINHKAGGHQCRQLMFMGNNYEKCVTKFLREECDIHDLASMRYDTQARRKAMLIYFLRMSKAMYDVRFERCGKTLFTEASPNDGAAPLKPWSLKIMYATMISKEVSSLLNHVGARTRLLSYYEMRDKPDGLLETYIKTGNTGKFVKKRPRVDWDSSSYKNHRALMVVARDHEEDLDADERTLGDRPRRDRPKGNGTKGTPRVLRRSGV